MNLAEKIEEIKRKPEHVRLYYVWGCVFFSMFFVIVIWIFSMQSGNSGPVSESIQVPSEIGEISGQLKDQKDKLQSVLEDGQKNVEGGVAAEGNNTDNPAGTGEVKPVSPEEPIAPKDPAPSAPDSVDPNLFPDD